MTNADLPNLIDDSAVADLLDQMAELQAALEKTNQSKREAQATVLATVQAELDAIDAEHAPMIEAANTRLAEIEATVKAAVLKAGRTIRGQYRMAVFAKGRTSWATEKLDGYAAAHPEILQFRSAGNPSISIRSSK